MRKRGSTRADRRRDADRVQPQQPDADADARRAYPHGVPKNIDTIGDRGGGEPVIVPKFFDGNPCRACPLTYTFDPNAQSISYEQFANGFTYGNALGYPDHCDRFSECYGAYRRFIDANPDESGGQPADG